MPQELDNAYPQAIVGGRTSGPVCLASYESGLPPAVYEWMSPGAGEGMYLYLAYPTRHGRYHSRVAVSVVDSATPFTIEPLGGSMALLMADRRFRAFNVPDVFSSSPVRVERLVNGHLVDVSRSFPAILRRDADRIWSRTSQPGFLTGNNSGPLPFGWLAVLQSWIADQCRLGKAAPAWKRAGSILDQPRNRGRLARHLPHYLAHLRVTLRRWGYC